MLIASSVDTLIVGAGPIGLACSISASRRGISHRVIDTGAIVESIVRYPIGMAFFTTPERLEIGGHPLTCAGNRATREEAMKYYRGVVRVEDLPVQMYARFLGAARLGHGEFDCRVRTRSTLETIRCKRLVLATGYFEHPNLLDVPGEALPHVSHWFDEAHRTAGLDVVVVGGKNSAVETALQCFRAGARVTLVYRGTALKPTVKYWLRPDFENRVRAGEITALFDTSVAEITPRDVVVTSGDVTGRVQADRVFALTGYHPDFDLMESLGLACDPVTGKTALDPGTLETTVPGLYLAGSAGAGRKTSEVFIENGRFDGERIFGDRASRHRAQALYDASPRPVGE